MKKIIIYIYLLIILPRLLFSQWDTQITNTIENLRTIYFINSITGYAAGENGVTLKTANGGNIWTVVPSGITQSINSIHFFNASTGIACADEGIIIRTTNSGTNWSSVASGVTDNLNAISFVNASGVCSGGGGTLLYSTDSGQNWTIAKNGFLSPYNAADMVTENVAYAAGVNAIFQPLVARSTNGGANWDFSVFYLNGNEGNLSGISFISETTGFATSRVFDGQGGVSRTTDGGANWTTHLVNVFLNSVDYVTPQVGYCVGEDGLILKTTTAGLGWDNQLGGNSVTLRCVQFSDSINGFAAGDMGKIIRTTNGGLSAVGNPNEIIPGKFSLDQNYPNPFNPSTVINYIIPSAVNGQKGNVILTVYNNMGQEITKLVNEVQAAGHYSVEFNGNNIPSGIYFYRLSAGEFNEVKKMILLK